MASQFTRMYCMAFKHGFTVYQSVFWPLELITKKINPFVNRLRLLSIKHLYTLRVELKLLIQLHENQLIQPTGYATATGEATITGEVMATGLTEIQSVQKMCDDGIIVTLWDRCFVCWPSSQLRWIQLVCLLAILLAQAEICFNTCCLRVGP